MYFFARDKATGTGIGILTPKPSYDEARDYDQMAASIVALDDTRPPMAELIYILSVDPQWSAPTATRRKEFAKLREALKYPMYFALISPSGLIRGVSTAVNWVSPPKKGGAGAFATVEEAITEIEKRCGRRLPILHKLYVEASSPRRS